MAALNTIAREYADEIRDGIVGDRLENWPELERRSLLVEL